MSGLVGIYFISAGGYLLFHRAYGPNPEIPASQLLKLFPPVSDAEPPSVAYSHNSTILHVTLDPTLYLVALANTNANVFLALSFLRKLGNVLSKHLNKIGEESFNENILFVCDVLDALIDCGYPQSSDDGTISQMAKASDIIPAMLQKVVAKTAKWRGAVVRDPPDKVTAVKCPPWRNPNTHHRKNEVFLDVMEKIDIEMSSTSKIINAAVSGRFVMRCCLSGLPQLNLGLNEKSLAKNLTGKTIELSDISFHQCVELVRYEDEKVITFIPPDGEFELMTYRAASSLGGRVRRPVTVETTLNMNRDNVLKVNKLIYNLRLKIHYRQRGNSALSLNVPLPPGAACPKFKSSHGYSNYVPEKDIFLWKIDHIGSQKELVMWAEFTLCQYDDLDQMKRERLDFLRRQIHINFDIPYYTASGLIIRYLTICEASGYQALPWVRYIAQNGSYTARID